MAYGWSAVFADRRKTFSNSDLERLTEQVFAILIKATKPGVA
jgi:hypothetical protein